MMPLFRRGQELAASAGVLTAAFIAGVVFQAYFYRGEATAAPTPAIADQVVEFDEAHAAGVRTAPVTIIEFSDFECPFCQAFARTTQAAIMSELVGSGDVRWVFKNLPLDEIHPNAITAGVAVLCAGDQGEFWPMHDWLFAARKPLTRELYRQGALNLRLDVADFDRCIGDGRLVERVKRDRLEADGLGIVSTPTFLIGRSLSATSAQVRTTFYGAKDAPSFRDAVAAIKENRPLKPSAPVKAPSLDGR